MSKHLCGMVSDKYHKTNQEEFLKIVDEPTHICVKCGRTASGKKYLCGPKKMKDKKLSKKKRQKKAYL